MEAPRGDGGYGAWIEDPSCLPAYRYADPPARVGRRAPGEPEPFHAFGNRRATAVGLASGGVRLFDAARGPIWWQGEPGGYVQVVGPGVEVLTLRRPETPIERVFGAAWFTKRVQAGPLGVEQTLFLPYGDDPVLLSLATITWSGLEPVRLRVTDHWGLDPIPLRFLAPRWLERLLARRVRWAVRHDAVRGILALRPLRPRRDPARSRAGGLHEQGVALLSLGSVPVAAGAVSEGPARPPLRLTLAWDLELRPGAPMRVATGFVLGDAPVVDAVRGRYLGRVPEALEDTVAAWRRRAPVFTVPGHPWAAREIAWSGCQLAQAALRDDYLDACRVTQGGNYLYVTGVDAAPRDLCQHAIAALHVDPALAADTVRSVCRLQRPDGHLPWDLSGYGVRDRIPFRPSDLDLWLLWAAAEVLLATRDRVLADEPLPWYPRRSGAVAPMREHLRTAFRRFALCGPLVMGLARHDPDRAFEEWVKASLARHADVYPGTWFGTWTAPDAFNAVTAEAARGDDPGGTWVGRIPLVGARVLAARDWPGMNAHAHGWPLAAAADLAGFGTDATGYVLSPRLPAAMLASGFRWTGEPWGLAWGPEGIEGHVRPAGRAAFRIRIRLPVGWQRVRVEVEGRPGGVRIEADGRHAVLDTVARDGAPVRFRLRKGTGVFST